MKLRKYHFSTWAFVSLLEQKKMREMCQTQFRTSGWPSLVLFFCECLNATHHPAFWPDASLLFIIIACVYISTIPCILNRQFHHPLTFRLFAVNLATYTFEHCVFVAFFSLFIGCLFLFRGLITSDFVGIFIQPYYIYKIKRSICYAHNNSIKMWNGKSIKQICLLFCPGHLNEMYIIVREEKEKSLQLITFS